MSNSDDSDSDGHQSPAKRPRFEASAGPSRKKSGSASYKTKFQKSWQKSWPFVAPVKGDVHAFYCTVCMKKVACGHQGERDVTRHKESAQHQSNTKAIRNIRPLSFRPSTSSVNTQVITNIYFTCEKSMFVLQVH